MVEQRSIEELFDEADPDIDQEEARKVKALIRRILQYDPANRPSPAEILRDPWFCEEEVGSGSAKQREIFCSLVALVWSSLSLSH